MAASKRPLNEHKASPFIVLDFETSDLDKKKSQITEIAMFSFRGDDLTEIGRYEALIQPYGNKVFSPKAEAVTGLTKEFLQNNGKPFTEVCEEVIAFMKEANVHNSTTGHKPVIVAHNALYESGFLQHMQNEGGVPIDKLLHGQDDYYGNFVPATIDTMFLAKMLWAANVRQTKYTLDATMERAGIEITDAHRAMNDVMPSTEFFKWIIKMLRGAESGGGGSMVQAGKELSFRNHFQF